MASQNSFEIEILPDGTLRVTTASFAGPVHIAADKLMLFLAENLDTGQRIKLSHAREAEHEKMHAGGIGHKH